VSRFVGLVLSQGQMHVGCHIECVNDLFIYLKEYLVEQLSGENLEYGSGIVFILELNCMIHTLHPSLICNRLFNR
jgi:hypothetical protein